MAEAGRHVRVMLPLVACLAGALTIRAAETQYDLTSGGVVGINGAGFATTDVKSTGTGVLDPFLRLQANGTEQGYNASLPQSGLMPDAKTGSWTHDIQLGSVPSGGGYYQFLLDINQSGNNQSALLSLDQLQIYTSSTATSDATAFPPIGALRYNLDGAGDSAIIMDASLTSGSGSGDLFAFIPTSAFSGATSSDYVYLFARFGDLNASNDGFEEFGLLSTGAVEPPIIPQGSEVPDFGGTLMLMGMGLIGVESLRRKLRLL